MQWLLHDSRLSWMLLVTFVVAGASAGVLDEHHPATASRWRGAVLPPGMVWRSLVPGLSARIAARVLVLTRVPVTPAWLVCTGVAVSKAGAEWRTAWLEAIQEDSATLASLATIRRGLGHP